MSRSRWKGSFIDKFIYKKTLKYKTFFLKKFIKKKKINISSLNLSFLSIKRIFLFGIFSIRTRPPFYLYPSYTEKTRHALNLFLMLNNHMRPPYHKTLPVSIARTIIDVRLLQDKSFFLRKKYHLQKKIFSISKSLLRLKNILKLKFNFAYKILIKKKFLKYKSIKFWSKRSTITNNIIGKKIFIYNGKIFKPITITRDMIGFKYGAFILTRKSRSSVKYKKN